jgi:type I restriction-modification system DNA methylase subunit
MAIQHETNIQFPSLTGGQKALATLTQETHKILSDYLREVKALPNESAKTHRFSALLASLFPGSSVNREYSAGVEKFVRIDTSSGQKTGRIDAYHGNAVIEFEKSLKATGNVAEKQLREYTAGVWKKEGKRQLICIASDGVVWRTYYPRTNKGTTGKLTVDDIELEPLRELELSEATLGDFWIWLTSVLFRPERLNPTAAQFQTDFGATSPAFADAMSALQSAWDVVGKEPEPRLAFETWQNYLTVTYGQLSSTGGQDASDEVQRLFLKHTYLASIARFLVWASLSKGKVTGSLSEVANEILSGRYFESQNIANLVEDDFFQWVRGSKADGVMSSVWVRVLELMQDYDLRLLNQDVLKGVYQELVDPKDRHDLGEYYTPQWLCERVVSELLPKSGFVSVLDPTCGSGSFLHATISHLLTANPSGGDATRLRYILDNVVGIDIHPLAVTIAKANYLLAVRALIKTTKRPIQVPVYLADALFLPQYIQQISLFEAPGIEIRFGKDRSRRVSMPDDLIQTPSLFDPAIAAASKVAIDHAETGKETQKTLQAYLRKVVPELVSHAKGEAMTKALWTLTQELSDLIKQKQNSIWSFIIRNSYRPTMLKGRFDYIIGNPPWLSYRYISDPEYQTEVKKRAIDDYAIAPTSQKLFTQMELATIFLVHTLVTFGRVGARIGFVIPRSIVSADQHENLRLRRYKAAMQLDELWDLVDVQPVFNVPTCVVFGTKTKDKPVASSAYTLPTIEWSGRLPLRDVSWSEAEVNLEAKKATSKVIYMGERNALSTKPGRVRPNTASVYIKDFHQGATLLPRSFYFVKIKDLDGKVDPDRLYWAETDPEQAEDAKPPYKDIFLKGHVEGRFIYSTAISKHVLPYVLLEPAVIILPIEETSGALAMYDAKRLREEGYREFSKWMGKVEEIWNTKRGEKAEKQTAYQRLDYGSGLTVQNLRSRYLVLYNAAGTNLSATYVDRAKLPMPFVVEHKLYWCSCANGDEAAFLVAILNADYVNEEIKPFQSHGLMGERDIEKKVLELPIPLFNPSDAIHKRIAELGKEAKKQADAFVSSATLPASLWRRRAVVREAVADTAGEIDKLVERLLSK